MATNDRTDGVVGPFPPGTDDDAARDDYDKLRRRVLWRMPSGLYLLGSQGAAPERRNLMTLNWATQVSSDPKLVGVGVEKPAFTHELIEEGGVFSVNVLAREDRAVVRKFVKPADVDLDASTLNGFAVRTGVSGAPIFVDAAAYVDCRVWQAVDCGAHTFFIGEIVDAGFQQPEDTEVLRMEDTRMNYGG